MGRPLGIGCRHAKDPVQPLHQGVLGVLLPVRSFKCRIANEIHLSRLPEGRWLLAVDAFAYAGAGAVKKTHRASPCGQIYLAKAALTGSDPAVPVSTTRRCLSASRPSSQCVFTLARRIGCRQAQTRTGASASSNRRSVRSFSCGSPIVIRTKVSNPGSRHSRMKTP